MYIPAINYQNQPNFGMAAKPKVLTSANSGLKKVFPKGLCTKKYGNSVSQKSDIDTREVKLYSSTMAVAAACILAIFAVADALLSNGNTSNKAVAGVQNIERFDSAAIKSTNSIFAPDTAKAVRNWTQKAVRKGIK